IPAVPFSVRTAARKTASASTPVAARSKTTWRIARCAVSPGESPYITAMTAPRSSVRFHSTTEPRASSTMSEISGIHHITAICGNAQENLDFYTGVLGLRLVKKSVNQDDPGTYHLFYADADGHPGTDITFFPFRNSPPGRLGHGLGVEIALAIPAA